MGEYADHPTESGLGKKVRPQPKQPARITHALKESKLGDRGAVTLFTRCGMSGPAPGLKSAPGAIYASGWNADVSCPACRRVPSVKKYLDKQKVKAQ